MYVKLFPWTELSIAYIHMYFKGGRILLQILSFNNIGLFRNTNCFFFKHAIGMPSLGY